MRPLAPLHLITSDCNKFICKHLYRYAPPAYDSIDELERKYWKNVSFNPPIYGADISGTLFDSDQDLWNLNRLGTILDCVTEDYGVKVHHHHHQRTFVMCLLLSKLRT